MRGGGGGWLAVEMVCLYVSGNLFLPLVSIAEQFLLVVE